jgi:hypothetical protein
MKVEVHYNHFDPEVPDDEWIPKCVANGWVILTGDKAIETNPINARAIEDSAAKVFITADTNSKAEEWAAAIIVGRRKLARMVEYNNGAFCVDVDKYATNHVSPERYRGGGGPKPREEIAVLQPPEEVVSAAIAEPEPLPEPQQVIQFPKDRPAGATTGETGENAMNGDRANKQIQRIRDMVKQSNSKCTIEIVPGELDSVHLTFHCGGQRRSVQWVGAWLETLSQDQLWRELEINTVGAIKKPTAS